jgi:hypothetical protein
MPPKKAKVKPLTITPTLNAEGKWKWKEVMAMKFENNTLGVFAQQDLPKGSKFEYFGTELTKKEKDDLVAEEEAKGAKGIPHRLAYIVQLSANRYVDVYHKNPIGVGGRGKFLGGCVNEPN